MDKEKKVTLIGMKTRSTRTRKSRRGDGEEDVANQKGAETEAGSGGEQGCQAELDGERRGEGDTEGDSKE
jgi:hypothetical protein